MRELASGISLLSTGGIGSLLITRKLSLTKSFKTVIKKISILFLIRTQGHWVVRTPDPIFGIMVLTLQTSLIEY